MDRGRPPTLETEKKDLEKGRVAAATAQIRDQLLMAFQQWLVEEDPHLPTLTDLAQQSPIRAALLLEEYETHAVRTGLDSPGLCGNHKHSGSRLSLLEELPGGKFILQCLCHC